MCLLLPQQILSIDGLDAICEVRGVRRRVSLMLLQGEPLEVGDFLMVRSGCAVARLSPREAEETLAALSEIEAALESEADSAIKVDNTG